jgi:hypothetical protein
LLEHQPTPNANRHDVQVLDTLVAMQRLADYIGRHGYHWWTSGEIAQDRTQHLVRKFATLYGIDLHRNTRSRRKKSGAGAAILLIYRLPRKVTRIEFNESGKNTVWWTLLVTDGRHSAFDRESLKDAHSVEGRFTVGQYQLVRATRPGQAKPVWTFKMLPSYYDEYRQRVIRSARGDPRECVSRLLHELYTEPGWRPIRSAVGRIVCLYRREWRKRRGRHEIFPKLPRLGYVQRLANHSAR